MIITGSKELRDFSGGDLTRISISEELTEVPREVLELAPSVKILDLSGNRITELPEWLAQLPNLEVIFLSNNRFTHVPPILGHLTSLRMIGMRANQIETIPPESIPNSLEWLTLTDNQISQLPHNLGRLPRLQKLLLAGNRLRTIPESFRFAQSLELIRLSANQFDSFPKWLFTIPTLAWLALGGNPCISQKPQSRTVSPISWNNLKIGGELGRGASGVTYRATLSTLSASDKEVAVKIFNTRVSSDGDGVDEVAAAVAAGSHPHLVSTLAPLCDHPENRLGLILELVPSDYRNLAAPPGFQLSGFQSSSFQSCTRDTYSDTLRFSISQSLEYASGIAKAVAHLHQCGIIHGDLYAHNILISESSALLSDFGAAYSYRGGEKDLVERIEVRAFGILLNELLSLKIGNLNSFDLSRLTILQALSNRCCSLNIFERPNFEQIISDLLDS